MLSKEYLGKTKGNKGDKNNDIRGESGRGCGST